MSKIFKDGVLTKIVEAIPGGGILTAPVHLAAGNVKHATQAILGATVSIATIPAGPLAAIAAKAAANGVNAIFDNVGLDEKFNLECKTFSSNGDHEDAARLMLTESAKKIQLFRPIPADSAALNQFMEATCGDMIVNGRQILHHVVKPGSSGTSRTGEER